ncbi:MAG TPA: type II toxin-antitoxin system RelE/ParE family toxin [Longimicrobium sp.]|jgi:plasmid stabilization system protein ParE|nr:type II toxin-antitoxin system RelE/ParE family toxin [Longimicrobium sp.]
MARRLTWSDSAIEDIEELATTLDRYSSAYSEAVVRALRKQADILPLFPLYGRIVPEWDDPAFREIIVLGRYRLIYQVETDSLLIVTVQDVRKVLPKWY